MNAIELAETQGHADCEHIHGDNGTSWGCLQTQYETFALWAREFLGYVPSNTYGNQRYVVLMRVQAWLDKGRTAREIALLYNHPASGGHTCGRGYNEKVGVHWDSCAYAQKVLALLP